MYACVCVLGGRGGGGYLLLGSSAGLVENAHSDGHHTAVRWVLLIPAYIPLDIHTHR